MRYVLFFDTRYGDMAEVVATAPDELRAHLERTREFHARGSLLLAGALDDPGKALSTMALFATRDDAEEFARGDPFVANGMIRAWSIRGWHDALTAEPGEDLAP